MNKMRNKTTRIEWDNKGERFRNEKFVQNQECREQKAFLEGRKKQKILPVPASESINENVITTEATARRESSQTVLLNSKFPGLVFVSVVILAEAL